MSFQAMAWAVQQELPMREKMVLLMLANYASNERGDCHPSVGLLAKDCGASKDSVMRAVKTLEDAGILSVNRRTKDGVNLPNTYTLNMQGVVAHSDHRGSRSQQGGVVAESDTNLSPEPINPSSLRSEGKREPSQFDELSKVLDGDHAQAVIAHRKNFKSKFSPYAARLLAKEFAKCPDPNLAAETMIRNGWQGFEAEWMQRQQSRGSPPFAAKPQTAAEILRNRRIQGNQTDDDRTAGTPRLVALGHVS
jgi:hypothetical protein